MKLRNRTLKVEFWGDTKLRGLTDGERLVYQGLWMACDDAGWGEWVPEELAALLWPYDDPTIREPKVIGGFTELRERQLLKLLRCGHFTIPSVPKHVWGGKDRRSATVKAAHDNNECPRPTRRRGVPRDAGASRGMPGGRVGEGRVGEGNNGLDAHQPNDEEGEVPDEFMGDHLRRVKEPQTPEQQIETWASLLRGPVNGRSRERAEAELAKLGYKLDGKELVKL